MKACKVNGKLTYAEGYIDNGDKMICGGCGKELIFVKASVDGYRKPFFTHKQNEADRCRYSTWFKHQQTTYNATNNSKKSKYKRKEEKRRVVYNTVIKKKDKKEYFNKLISALNILKERKHKVHIDYLIERYSFSDRCVKYLNEKREAIEQYNKTLTL